MRMIEIQGMFVEWVNEWMMDITDEPAGSFIDFPLYAVFGGNS